MEDKRIIELFFLRSEQAITELAYKYGSTCKKIAYNILNNLEDADECVNDAYLGAWNSIPPQNPNPLVTYVCKITRNTALKRYRYNTAEKRNGYYAISLSELEECIPAAGKEVGCSAEEELVRAIEGFLSLLDKKSRVMFVKRYWYAEPVKAIAEDFGMTENHVAVKLSRVREKLKKYLEKEGIIL